MKPRSLSPGATVALVSPASPLAEDKLSSVTSLLHEAGYRTTRFPHALDSSAYLAGRDQDRAADLQAAFADPNVQAILCTRGGYGCARLFPFLDLDAIAQSRKLFLGFSDITTLHLALNRRGLPTLHAPMALTLHHPRDPWVADSFLRSLGGDLSVPDGAPTGETVVPGRAEGIVTGGCLILVCDSLATPNAIDARGKIVLLEDVDEAPHRVDAMLTHLLNAGVLQSAAGLVVGEMTRSNERVDEGIGGVAWEEIVRERLGPLGIPTIMSYPFGHAPNQLTLGLGVRAVLDADRGSLTYTEALCAD